MTSLLLTQTKIPPHSLRVVHASPLTKSYTVTKYPLLTLLETLPELQFKGCLTETKFSLPRLSKIHWHLWWITERLHIHHCHNHNQPAHITRCYYLRFPIISHEKNLHRISLTTGNTTNPTYHTQPTPHKKLHRGNLLPVNTTKCPTHSLPLQEATKYQLCYVLYHLHTTVYPHTSIITKCCTETTSPLPWLRESC